MNISFFLINLTTALCVILLNGGFNSHESQEVLDENLNKIPWMKQKDSLIFHILYVSLIDF